MKGIITVCSECASNTQFQKIAIEFEREGMKVVAHGVAAMVCPNCGEQYIPAAVSRRRVGSRQQGFRRHECP